MAEAVWDGNHWKSPKLVPISHATTTGKENELRSLKFLRSSRGTGSLSRNNWIPLQRHFSYLVRKQTRLTNKNFYWYFRQKLKYSKGKLYLKELSTSFFFDCVNVIDAVPA